MKPSLKAITIALAMGTGAMIAVPSLHFVQPVAAETVADREVLARTLIAEALPASHMPEIYDDLRAFVHTVYLPAMHDIVSGKIDIGIPVDSVEMQQEAKVLAFMDLAVKAADEADPFIKSSREEIITELAQHLAKHLSVEELESARSALKLNATRKGFDAIYTISKAITGYTYEDMRDGGKFSGALYPLVRRAPKEGVPLVINATPSQAQLSKAQAIVNDAIRISRMDEIVAEGIRFARDVVIKSLPPETQAAASAQVDQFEFQYKTTKAPLIVVAQSYLAQIMTDEELERTLALVQSPVFAKVCSNYYNLEKSVTALTLDDVSSAQAFIEDVKKIEKLRNRTAQEQAAVDADWAALVQKWSDKIMNAASPQTREALMKSMAEMETFERLQAPIARKQ